MVGYSLSYIFEDNSIKYTEHEYSFFLNLPQYYKRRICSCAGRYPKELTDMRKKFTLNTVSLGSEPESPKISSLTDLVSKYKGIEADLLTFQLLLSYSSQKMANIDEIGTGGKYYRPRLDEALKWDEELGPSIQPEKMVNDYSLITKHDRTIRSVHESPSLISSSPSPEDEDGFAEMCHGFSLLMRTLRDARIYGHIIHMKNPVSLELELLSTPKNLLLLHEPDPDSIEELLENTQNLVLSAEKVSLLEDLVDRYQVRNLYLYGASAQDIDFASQYMDPDHMKIAGYCLKNEEEFWKKLTVSAIISV